MKIALSSSFLDFFNKNKFIEIESLVQESTLKQLQTEYAMAISEKLNAPLRQSTPSKIFAAGHDAWRKSPQIKKYVTQNNWSEIASELCSYRPLRLGFEQFFAGGPSSKEEDVYTQLLKKQISLEDYSSVNEIQCGLMLCLNAPETKDATDNIFSAIPGNAVFFKKDFIIDFNQLTSLAKGQYLLLVYVQRNSVYILNENDPFAHYLKGLGYVFGDRLNDKLNPIVFR